MAEARRDVVIIGAGIAGLTAAFYLRRAGLSVVVIEKSEIPGGVVRTENKDGFLLEYGPNSMLLGAGAKRLVSDLSLDSELVRPFASAKNRFVATRRADTGAVELCPTPRSLAEAISTPLLSSKAKLRALAEPFIRPTRRKDESVRDFITRRFGQDVADRLVDPALGGIWAADISRLSSRTAISRLWELEQREGSVIGGMIKTSIRGLVHRKSGNTKRRSELVSFRSGMSRLYEALAHAVGSDLLLRHSVQSLTFEADSAVVRTEIVSAQAVNSSNQFSETITARHALVAVDSIPSSKLLEPLDQEAAEFIAGVPYAPIGILHLAIQAGSAARPLDGFGFLVPRSLGGNLLGAIFSSSLFEGRAPQGMELLTCFIGGATHPQFSDATDEKIAQSAVEEVRAMLEIRGNIEIIDQTYIPKAIPNYPLGHRRTQERVEELERQTPGLTVLGNWLKGTGVPDRIDCGIEAAEKIAKRLKP